MAKKEIYIYTYYSFDGFMKRKEEEEIRIIRIEARFGLYIIVVGSHMGMRQPAHCFGFATCIT